MIIVVVLSVVEVVGDHIYGHYILPSLSLVLPVHWVNARLNRGIWPTTQRGAEAFGIWGRAVAPRLASRPAPEQWTLPCGSTVCPAVLPFGFRAHPRALFNPIQLRLTPDPILILGEWAS